MYNLAVRGYPIRVRLGLVRTVLILSLCSEKRTGYIGLTYGIFELVNRMDRYDISMFGLVVGYAGPLLENLVVMVDDISRAKPY